jgi:hypothetical protein
MPKWFWQAQCKDRSGCHWKSRWFRSRQMARTMARLHVAVRHPWGKVTIGATDRSRARQDLMDPRFVKRLFESWLG